MARRNWSSRSIGSKPQHAVFRALARFGGYRAAYCLLFWVVLWYTLFPSVRNRSAAYRKRRFPEDGRVRQWLRAARLHAELGKVLVDRAVAGITGKFSARTPDEDVALLAGLHAEGKGLILLTGHIGYWQMAAWPLREYVDSRVTILLHREEGDNDRHFFDYERGGREIGIVASRQGASGAAALLRALQRGEIVALAGDRAYGNDAHTAPVRFLGGEILLPCHAYRLSSASGAPIVVFFACREGPCAARYEIAAVIRVPENRGRRAEEYRPYMEQFAFRMEDAVQKEPYQFFNFYDMWERTR